MVSLGQRLRQERLKKRLSIDEVAKATKIRTSFLLAIENGQYAKLPSSAYIQGFVKNYADFLGLPKKESTALFRREFNEKEFIRVLPKGLWGHDDIPIKRFRLTQTVLIIVFILFALLGFLLYQYRFAFLDPPLEVSFPSEGQVVKKTLKVLGKTDPNATVMVNESLVSLDSDGKFSKTISLFPGPSTIKVQSQNRFGHKTQVERHVEVKEE